MCASLYEYDILIQSAKDKVLFARAGGGGESGELLLNRYRVSVWKMKCSGDGWQQWWWFHNNVNTLNATELYT